MCLIIGAGEKNDCTVGDNGLVADLIGNEFQKETERFELEDFTSKNKCKTNREKCEEVGKKRSDKGQ